MKRTKNIVCLGIEGTAHTFGIGIVDSKGNILADERDMYKPPLGRGIIPNDAAEHHKRLKEKILENALTKANLSLDDIDIFSYSAGPGLAPCLLVTANFAIELSKKIKKPLIPVNHPCAHLEIGKLTTDSQDPVFLYLSGGNTQIIAYVDGIYRIFGETEDIPVGNCFDVVAREMNLPMPGGPEIEKLAKGGKYVKLPLVIKGMDVSFSGILTAAKKLINRGVSKEDIAFSLQETCFSMLVEVTERAMAHIDKNEVLLIGGVAANKRLQEMLKIMCNDRGGRFFVVPEEYSGDQGIMIAWNGILQNNSGWKDPNILNRKINSNWRIDDVEVTWM